MVDCGTVNLDDHGVTDLIGHVCRFIGVFCHPPWCDGDPVGFEDSVDFKCRKDLTARPFSLCNDFSGSFGVDVAEDVWLTDIALLDAAVLDKGPECLGGVAGVCIVRDVAVLEDRHGLLVALEFQVGHEVANHRLPALLVDFDNLASDSICVGEGRRDEVDIDAVDLFVVHHDVQGAAELRASGCGDNVNRVLQRRFGELGFTQTGD